MDIHGLFAPRDGRPQDSIVNVTSTCLTDDQYKHWHKHLSTTEAAWTALCGQSALVLSAFPAPTGLPM